MAVIEFLNSRIASLSTSVKQLRYINNLFHVGSDQHRNSDRIWKFRIKWKIVWKSRIKWKIVWKSRSSPVWSTPEEHNSH